MRNLALVFCRETTAPVVSDDTLSLTYADTVAVLMKACGIAPGAKGAFESRVRHLQRLGMLSRPGDAGGRLHYGIVELALLATAIRLIDTFMSPALATRYVAERWEVLAPFVLAGACEAIPQGYLVRRTISSASHAVFRANGLASLGRRQNDERNEEPLGRVIVCDGTHAAAVVAATNGAGLVLDSRTYMPIIVAQWAERLSATDSELAAELDRLQFVG